MNNTPTRKEMEELLNPARILRNKKHEAIQEARAEEAEQKEAERQSKVKAEQDVKERQHEIDKRKMASAVAILGKANLK